MSFPKWILLAGFFTNTVFASPFSTSPLIWEQTTQTNTVKDFEVTSSFIFKVRNLSAETVIIDEVKPSCGCTAAKVPGKPWRLGPHEDGQFEALVDVHGKTGTLFKDIKVLSATAPTSLNVTVIIPPGRKTLAATEENRIWGQQLATTDHQAVFKKTCVKCHLEPAFGKSGEPLYQAACGICHEAKHRATMVPDLHSLTAEIDSSYWRNWVTHGREGTLMPGFAATEGGPLDEPQITSLVAFLTKAFPRPIKSAAVASAEKGN